LALLGRRPHQRVEGHVIAGVRETYTISDIHVLRLASKSTSRRPVSGVRSPNPGNGSDG